MTNKLLGNISSVLEEPKCNLSVSFWNYLSKAARTNYKIIKMTNKLLGNKSGCPQKES